MNNERFVLENSGIRDSLNMTPCVRSTAPRWRSVTRFGAIAASFVLIGLAATAVADDYDKDVEPALASLKGATFLRKDTAANYATAFRDYDKERNDCLSALV